MNAIFQNYPVYLSMAIIGTVLYLIKLVLLIFAGDAGDADFTETDVDFDGHLDGSETFTLLSVQSILAFLMGTGWIGVAAIEEWDLTNIQAALAAGGFGLFLMVGNAFLMFKVRGLNKPQNTFDIKSCVGQTGKAYINIPPKGEGLGQVEINVSGRQQILQAINNTTKAIPAFSQVRVKEVDAKGTIIVEKI